MTTTSGGAGRVWNWLDDWIQTRGWDVHMTAVTDGYASINVAGPNSRELVGRLTDLDLAAESFPYMRVRTGTVAGVDDAIMLDLNGFVAETNATNVFVVRDGELDTPLADACLPGITRGIVIKLASDSKLQCHQCNLSLTEVYTADEMFVTGTMGELTPVLAVDGRQIGNGQPGRLTKKLA